MVYPSVWVNDEDVEQAKELAAEFDRAAKDPETSNETWTCPTCGEVNSTQYTECWNCAEPDASI